MTLEDLRARRSVRTYDERPLTDSDIRTLKAEISYINSHGAGLRFQLVADDPRPFAGFKASYGLFKGVRNYVAAVIDASSLDSEERAGFYGQQFVMKAQSLGLGTCFVGATMNSDVVNVQFRAGDKLAFLITVGYPKEGRPRFMERLTVGFVHSKKINSRAIFDDDRSAMTYDEAKRIMPLLPLGIDAISCAPSHVNCRPTRLWMDENGRLHAGTHNTSGFNPVDLGIAKFNFAALVPGYWQWGNNAAFIPE